MRLAARFAAGRGRAVAVELCLPDPRTMLDIVFIAAALAFFATSAGYARLCERL